MDLDSEDLIPISSCTVSFHVTLGEERHLSVLWLPCVYNRIISKICFHQPISFSMGTYGDQIYILDLYVG